MKKNLLMLLLLAAAVTPVLAQGTGNGPSAELSAGVNQSRFTDEGADCLCWQLFFGGDVIFYERGPLRFSSGAQYRGSGSAYRSGEDFGEGENYSFETSERLAYLGIPLEARYEFGAGNLKPFVRGGGMLGFLLSAKSKTTTTFNGRKDENETDLKQQKQALHFAFSLGGGVSFPLGKYRGSASVRYLLGVTNIVKTKNAPSARTNDLTYSVGIGIPLF